MKINILEIKASFKNIDLHTKLVRSRPILIFTSIKKYLESTIDSVVLPSQSFRRLGKKFEVVGNLR